MKTNHYTSVVAIEAARLVTTLVMLATNWKDGHHDSSNRETLVIIRVANEILSLMVGERSIPLPVFNLQPRNDQKRVFTLPASASEAPPTIKLISERSGRECSKS